jgi:hypothetical protein
MGRLIKRKMIGKNFMVAVYYFRDGYRIYAYRKKPGSDVWIESSATSYPIESKEEALKNLNEYKSVRDVLILHPALR